jgi:hypothetical protein
MDRLHPQIDKGSSSPFSPSPIVLFRWERGPEGEGFRWQALGYMPVALDL